MTTDYKKNAEEICEQAWNLFPSSVNYNYKTFLTSILKQYYISAFESLTNDISHSYSEQQADFLGRFITEIIYSYGLAMNFAKISKSTQKKVFTDVSLQIVIKYSGMLDNDVEKDEDTYVDSLNTVAQLEFQNSLSKLSDENEISPESMDKALNYDLTTDGYKIKETTEEKAVTEDKKDNDDKSVDNEYYEQVVKKFVEPLEKKIPYDMTQNDRSILADFMYYCVRSAIVALTPGSKLYFTREENDFACGVIANWLYCFGVDICRANIPDEFKTGMLYSILDTAWNYLMRGLYMHWESTRIAEIVRYQVNKTYKYEIERLYKNKDISMQIRLEALSQSRKDELENEHYTGFENYIKTTDNELFNDLYYIKDSERLENFEPDDSVKTSLPQGYKFDSKILNDRILDTYARQIAYRYLIKAARILKEKKYKKNIKRLILRALSYATDDYINTLFDSDECKLTKETITRLLTQTMHLFFKRILALNYAGISFKYWNEIFMEYSSAIYYCNVLYSKKGTKPRDAYTHTKSYSSVKFVETLRSMLNETKITEEQFKKAKIKIYVSYLTKEIYQSTYKITFWERVSVFGLFLLYAYILFEIIKSLFIH